MSTPGRRKASTSVAVMVIGLVALVSGLVTLLSGETRGGVTLIVLGLVNFLTFVWLRRSEERAHQAGGWYVFSGSYRAAMIAIGVGGIGLAIWIAVALGRRTEVGVASVALGILGIAGLLFLALGAILNVVLGLRMQQGKTGRFARWWFPGWRAVAPDDGAPTDAENRNPPSE